MRVYVATAFGNREKAKEFIRQLRLAGHTAIGDWTWHSTDGETSGDAEALCRAFAEEDRFAVSNAEALVLLHDERGKGSFAELGIAVGSRASVGWPRYIIVVGGKDAAPYLGPIFYLLREVKHVDTPAEAIDLLTQLAAREQTNRALEG